MLAKVTSQVPTILSNLDKSRSCQVNNNLWWVSVKTSSPHELSRFYLEVISAFKRRLCLFEIPLQKKFHLCFLLYYCINSYMRIKRNIFCSLNNRKGKCCSHPSFFGRNSNTFTSSKAFLFCGGDLLAN